MRPDENGVRTGKAYTSGMSKTAVKSASCSLGNELSNEHIDQQLQELVDLADDLEAEERQQLEDILRLETLSAGNDAGADSVISLPGSFSINIDSDGMIARLNISPAINGGQNVTADQILNEIRRRNLSELSKAEPIARAILAAEQGQTVENLIIAEGVEPTKGTNGKATRYGRQSPDTELVEVSDDDLERQHEYPIVCRANDCVMIREPSVPGKDGIKVDGTPIPAQAVVDRTPQAGQNIRVEGVEYFAEIDGVVSFSGDHVEVRNCLIVHHDVTRAKSPIDFDGDIHIIGGVGDKVMIEATGNVLVDGVVEAATIRSRAGSVVLRHGVAGKSQALISASQDISFKYAENATLSAGRDIRFAGSAMGCRVSAGRSILAEQGKGQLVGGTAVTDERISVVRLGAKGGLRTDVRVGVPAKVLADVREIDQTDSELSGRRATCQEAIEKIELAVRDPTRLAEEELKVYTQLRKLRVLYDHKLRILNDRRREILAEALDATEGRVQVKSEVASNVRVSIGNRSVDVEPCRGACTIMYNKQDGQVVVSRR